MAVSGTVFLGPLGVLGTHVSVVHGAVVQLVLAGVIGGGCRQTSGHGDDDDDDNEGS